MMTDFNRLADCHIPWIHPTGFLLLTGAWAAYKNISSRVSLEKAILWDQRNDINKAAIVKKKMDQTTDFELKAIYPPVFFIILVLLQYLDTPIFDEISSFGNFLGCPNAIHAIVTFVFLLLAISFAFILSMICRYSEPGTLRRITFLACILVVPSISFLFWENRLWFQRHAPEAILCMLVFGGGAFGVRKSISRAYDKYKIWSANITLFPLWTTILIDTCYFGTFLYGLGAYVSRIGLW